MVEKHYFKAKPLPDSSLKFLVIALSVVRSDVCENISVTINKIHIVYCIRYIGW